MKKRIKYYLYKQVYSNCPATDYDKSTKTILVDIPDKKSARRVFPRDWVKHGNHYTTPHGTCIYYWNTGIQQHYVIEYITYKNNYTTRCATKSIEASLTAFDEMLKAVAEIEG